MSVSKESTFSCLGLWALSVLGLLRIESVFSETFNVVILIPESLGSSAFVDSLMEAGQLATERVNADVSLTGLRSGNHRLNVTKTASSCDTKGGMKAAVGVLITSSPQSGTAAFVGKKNYCTILILLFSTKLACQKN